MEKKKKEWQTKKQALNYRECIDGYHRRGGWEDGENRGWGFKKYIYRDEKNLIKF